MKHSTLADCQVKCLGDNTCPGCIANRRGRSCIKGHRYGSRAIKRKKWEARVEMTDMKKPEQAAAAANGKSGVFPDLSWSKKYPTLAQYLATDVWDDGTPRERSALSVFTEDGVVKVACNDKEMERSCYASATTLEAALSLMEKGISDGTATWRAWQQKKGAKK